MVKLERSDGSTLSGSIHPKSTWVSGQRRFTTIYSGLEVKTVPVANHGICFPTVAKRGAVFQTPRQRNLNWHLHHHKATSQPYVDLPL